MDNFFEIIIFIITAVIFVVSAVTKQKKKSVGNSNGMDNLVESFLGIPQDEYGNNVSQAKEEQVLIDEMKEAKQAKEPLNTEKNVDAMPEFKEDELRSEDEVKTVDFDVRQAVIYSEILNRKHF